jgi:hypothetical protein
MMKNPSMRGGSGAAAYEHRHREMMMVSDMEIFFARIIGRE